MEQSKYLKRIKKATTRDKVNDIKTKACMDDEITLAESIEINKQGNNRISEINKQNLDEGNTDNSRGI